MRRHPLSLPIQFLSTALLSLVACHAFASERCEYNAPRELNLNLSGIKTVVFDIGAQELKLNASKGAAVSIKGRACASEASLLPQLTLTQRRNGDKLVVRAQQDRGMGNIDWSNRRYAYLTVTATLPDDMPVQVNVGSGDAHIAGVMSLAADVGSGDLDATHIRGALFADVGSGDIVAKDIGELHVVSVGSGDLSADGVRGTSRIGSVNSGDLKISNALGNVEIDSIGSGDVSLSDIGASIMVRSIGSGDLDIKHVRGALTVDKVGSGSVSHHDVSGTVHVPEDD